MLPLTQKWELYLLLGVVIVACIIVFAIYIGKAIRQLNKDWNDDGQTHEYYYYNPDDDIFC